MKDFAKSIVCNTKVGNANYRYKGYLITKSDEDGEIIVYEPNGRDVAFRGTKSESMARDWCDHHAVGNSMVGNALKYTNLEEAKKMCQQMNDSLAPDAALRHYRHVYEKDGAYYVMETGEATAKGMKRVGNMKNWNYITGTKIGNRTASEIEKEIAEVESSIDSYYRAGENPPKTLEDRLKKLQAELANAKTGNSTEKLFEGLSKDAEKEEEKSDEALDELKKTGNKAGEKNVWKEGPYHIEQLTEEGKFGWYTMPKGSFIAYRNDVVYGNFKSLDEAKRMLKDEIRKDKEFNRKYTTNSKTGNYKTGKSSLKPGDKVQSYGVKGTVKSVHEEFTDSIYGEPLIEVEFENGTTKKIGEHYLVKVGNSVGDEYNAEIQRLTKKAEQLRRMGQGKQASEVEKQIEKLGKELREIGNSASDDKFAYVMREFEEGKLKTPDGKVVTDPQQAKAIAYSESKKTENGLARARNAMNPVIYKGYTIRYRPNTGKYYISSGPNDTYVAKFAYKEYSSEQDAKDAIDGSR